MKKVTAVEISLKKVHWDEMFDNEQEMLKRVLKMDLEKGIVPRGYEYLRGMQKSYAKYGKISDKQMTQLKRLAKNVYAVATEMMIGGTYVRI